MHLVPGFIIEHRLVLDDFNQVVDEQHKRNLRERHGNKDRALEVLAVSLTETIHTLRRRCHGNAKPKTSGIKKISSNFS